VTQAVLFYFYAAVAVGGAVALVSTRNILRGALGLFATIIAIGGLFLLLGSEFLAAMQLFVYGGAITVLVLFALMLAGPRAQDDGRSRVLVRRLAAGVCVAFLGAVVMVLMRTTWNVSAPIVHDTASIATILFSRYVIPFEIAGLSLTIALIGAIVIAREDDVIGVPVEAEPAAGSAPEEGGAA
jgi:NADH-quinone oxidoreductase subunit J